MKIVAIFAQLIVNLFVAVVFRHDCTRVERFAESGEATSADLGMTRSEPSTRGRALVAGLEPYQIRIG
jgi:hypothetical protein